jgi:hypothetical protein
MKKIKFQTDVLPHTLAVGVFLIVTILFFNPVFFGNKTISQGDITQFLWGSKELRDYRSATGEEGLWSNSMFSGMPAYMVNMEWSDGIVAGMKNVLSFFLPHPVRNIFLAFVCYYIMLLAFRVRPYLAVAGALAFGLSSYMIIGLSAGHNARIGAIAFMPLVVAGIHLAFSGRRVLGLGVSAAALALHLRENHIQITYYLLIIVVGYGVVQLAYAWKQKSLAEYFKTIAVLVGAALVAAGTFFGPMWAVTELSQYSTRGKSELVSKSVDTAGSGLPKSYAFQYSNGIIEPITLLIPNFYGGSSSNYLVNDQKSQTYQALANTNDQNMANQLAQYSSPYWGSQPLSAPYYGGAIIVFLFAFGMLVVERKYVWWLVPVSVFAIMLSWGSNFEAFNYWMFDHLPAYNKFRSVTFSMIIVFFSLPLLGMLGLEKLLEKGLDAAMKKKLLIAFGSTGGLCVLLWLFAGVFDFMRPFESELPAWFLNALRDDRKGLFRDDLVRSFAFIGSIFILLFLNVPKKISPIGFFTFLIAMVAIDLAVVDGRYFSKDNYQRKRDNADFEPTKSDSEILKDKGRYRVFNLAEFYEAKTSLFHQSLGGYHGVRLKRYQELYDSAITREQERLFSDARQGNLNTANYGVLNMLNAKYLVYGQDVIPNPHANGNAWFVDEVVKVKSANEELSTVSTIDTKRMAVIDETRMKTNDLVNQDSVASIRLVEQKPNWLKYEAKSTTGGLAVFSEIFYPKGWTATIDGKEVPILRADYVLRAIEVPAGNHTIEFVFQPKPYLVGDKVTMASSWLLLLLVLGTLGWTLRQEKVNEEA